MDTSLGQALIIIASVLLAMLVIGFVTHTFLQTSQWATAQDQEEAIEQAQKFNKEWEAYDKKLMYGVDVISCLNKAVSNNDKVNNGSIVNGEKYDDSYAVTVIVKLKNALTETIKVYYMNEKGKQLEYSSGVAPTVDSRSLNNVFDISGTYINSNISNINYSNTTLSAIIKKETKITSGEYELNKDSLQDDKLVILLKNVTELKQIKKNTSQNHAMPNSWTMAEWETPLYDLKTRKFKCSDIQYDSNTGRINKITFTEL